MVIENPPVVDRPGRPPQVFTTLYWLTCPLLIRRLSRFESAGWVRRLDDAVRQNRDLSESIDDVGHAYAYRRFRRLGKKRWENLSRSRPNLADSLRNTGIAGVRRPAGSSAAPIKCLHAHAAYHLAEGGHPLFEAFPELLTDVSSCRDCEVLTAHAL